VEAQDRVASPLGAIGAAVPNGIHTGAAVTLAIRPEHVQVAAAPSYGIANTVGKVTSKNYLGDSALLEVEVNGVTLLAKLAGDTELNVGQQAVVEMPALRWQVFP
jgi:ABC-type sugar transport system ATPase subunit